MKKLLAGIVVVAIAVMLFQSCRQGPPIRTADQVNLDRFMGDWYVIANIPTFIEKGAHNALESYTMKEQDVVDTTFTFNKDSFDGKKKEYNPTGYVRDDPSNAVWGMQFLWPFKSEYIIVYVDADYRYTIIGRTKRDYLWIMARESSIPEAKLDELIQMAVEEGYDRAEIRKVPQQWDQPQSGQ